MKTKKEKYERLSVSLEKAEKEIFEFAQELLSKFKNREIKKDFGIATGTISRIRNPEKYPITAACALGVIAQVLGEPPRPSKKKSS